jgi:hypothetical protein
MTSELGAAALALPLAFFQGPNGVQIVAVLGLSDGQNLFVAPDGKWAGSYMPAAFKGYPFKLAKHEDAGTILCFDEGSGLLATAAEGVSFFNDDGTPSDATNQMFEFLVNMARGQEALASASGLLSKHGVLEPWHLKVREGDNEREVGGLLKVNEANLNALDDVAHLELRRGGSLPVAYAQLLSMSNIAVLGKLTQAHKAYHQRQTRSQQEQASYFETKQDEQIDWNAIFDDEQKS